VSTGVCFIKAERTRFVKYCFTFNMNGHTSRFHSQSRVYSVINSTTGKYSFVALVWNCNANGKISHDHEFPAIFHVRRCLP